MSDKVESFPLTVWLDDLEPARTYRTPARTITESDVVTFAGLSGDYHPLHTDTEHAYQSDFGERIAHGLLGLSVAAGLLARLSMFEKSGLSFLSIAWDFVGPIRLGDTIHVHETVTDVRVLSDGLRGVVDFETVVHNQRDEVVQRGTRRLMVARRPTRDAAEGPS